MSSGWNLSSMRDVGVWLTSATRAATAACAIASTGWRTVVSGGSVKAMSGESSNPTTDRSRGTCMPRACAARIAPRAMRSEPQITAVCPESMSSSAAAWPPSTVNSVETMCGRGSSMPSWTRFARNAASLRWAGMKRSGPIARPMRRWPSDVRCRNARSSAAASSVDMLGASMSSTWPFTSTIGTPRPRSRW